jgi:hypothetical protein
MTSSAEGEEESSNMREKKIRQPYSQDKEGNVEVNKEMKQKN